MVSFARISVALLCLGWSCMTWAARQVDVFTFDNDDQRARFQNLVAELRCPKCLNTNIAGSDAPIAQDLRKLVHRMLVVEGRSDQEILDFLQARYGDFVLYDPPFNARTWLIWLLPLGIGLIIIFWLTRIERQARDVDAEALSPEEQARLRRVIAEE